MLTGFIWLLWPAPASGGAEVLFDLIKAYSIYQKGRVLFGGKKVAEEIGRSIDRSVRKQFGVETDPKLNAWVASIFDRIKAAAPPGINYTCTIIKADFVNAMAVPGGYIYVTVPLLELVTTDDELASVMGHEIAHIVKNHGMEMAKRNIALGTLIEAALKDGAEYRDEISLMYNLFMLSYSRDNEYDADVEGLPITAKAAYNPLGMIAFLKSMLKREKKEGNRPMEWLSTHPTTEGRIHKVRQEIYRNQTDLSKPMYLSFAEIEKERRPANLAPNGGFEVMTGEAVTPDKWTLRQGAARWFPDDSYLGDASLLCGENSGSTSITSDRFSLNPENHYLLSGRLKKINKGTLSVHLACYDKEGHMKKADIVPTRPADVSVTWHRWEMFAGRLEPEEKEESTGTTIEVFTLPPETAKAQLTIVVTGSQTGTILLDELVLRPVTKENPVEPFEENMLINPDFEYDFDRNGQPDGWRLTSGVSTVKPKAFDGYTSIRFEGEKISSPLAKKLAAYRQRVYNVPIGGEEISLTAQPIPVSLEQDYLIGVHSLGGTTVEAFELQAEILDERGDRIPGAGGKAIFITAGYWQRHCLALKDLGIPPFLKIPENSKPAMVQLVLRSNLRPGSEIWIDSMFMRKTLGPPKSADILFTTPGP